MLPEASRKNVMRMPARSLFPLIPSTLGACRCANSSPSACGCSLFERAFPQAPSVKCSWKNFHAHVVSRISYLLRVPFNYLSRLYLSNIHAHTHIHHSPTVIVQRIFVQSTFNQVCSTWATVSPTKGRNNISALFHIRAIWRFCETPRV